jgi:hypothetical protein
MIDLIQQSTRFEEVAPDILTTPFLTKDFCETLIDCAKEFSNWEGPEDQTYPTQNLHLHKELPVFHQLINEGLEDQIWRKAQKWWNVDRIQTKDLFIIKYSTDTQTSLDLHHDDSFISASIKLNNDYDGGALYFPHQRFSTEDIPAGNIILWPSKVTHLHGAKKITAGEKYSITIWTEECSAY